ncbi:MAG: thiamine phosphate synthase [Gemmatimonadota bacterium]
MSPAELARRLRLIVITDAALAAPRSVEDVVERALAAGAPAVQLRDKNASARELLTTGGRLLALTRAAGALLFLNDRADVALALGADGVHLGPDDVPVAALRRAVPEGFLIGASADDPEVARGLVADGADYIGCGAVYATSTKPDAGDVIGLEGLERVAAAVAAPVIGIGGIDVARSAEVAQTRAAGMAVVGAVMRAPDVRAAVRGLLAPWAERR